MRISICTPTAAYHIAAQNQVIELDSPLANLDIVADKNEICTLIDNFGNAQPIDSSYSHNLEFNINNSATIKIICNGKTIIMQFNCRLGNAIRQKTIENLMNFYTSLAPLSDPQSFIQINSYIDAVNSGLISLLNVQKPLTGYNDKSLLNLLEKALKQKIRAICTNPKKGTRIDEVIQDVNLVKRINSNTIKHLASHSEHWKSRTLNGLIPKRLKADFIEDDINIYENLFFKMAIDDISLYTTRQILAIRQAHQSNKNAIDWEAYGNQINDYKRAEIVNKLLNIHDINSLIEENEVFSNTLRKWESLSKTIMTIRNSAFYKSIDNKKHISKNVHITNILKNDQRYKALYDIWNIIKTEKSMETKETIGLASDINTNFNAYYSSYSILSLIYAMSLENITFSNDSIIKKDNYGNIQIQAEACDFKFRYELKTRTNSYGLNTLDIHFIERIDLSYPIPEIITLNSKQVKMIEGFATFDQVKHILHFHKIPDTNDQNLFRNIFKLTSEEYRKLSLQEKKDNKADKKSWISISNRILNDCLKHEHKNNVLHIVPIFFYIATDQNAIQKITDNLFRTAEDSTIFLLPNQLEEFRSIDNVNILKRLFNYGESFCAEEPNKWKNYRIGILPINQNDIGSIQRLMKIISLHRSKLVMEIENDNPKHCPVCGSTLISYNNTSECRCENPACGIEWGLTHCVEGCNEYFHWIRPNSKFKNNEFDCETECDKILKKDSLFDNYVITDFEFEKTDDDTLILYPICPKCGTRRFKDENKS